MQKEKHDFKLDEYALLNWSSELEKQNHLPEDIAILRLTCQLYPKSSYDQEALGEAYMKDHQTRLAIEAFKVALKLDPDSQNVRSKLKELGDPAGKPN